MRKAVKCRQSKSLPTVTALVAALFRAELQVFFVRHIVGLLEGRQKDAQVIHSIFVLFCFFEGLAIDREREIEG